MEQAQEVGKSGLPNSELIFVHDIGGEEFPMIEALICKAYRERALGPNALGQGSRKCSLEDLPGWG